MKRTQGKANPSLTQAIFEEEFSENRQDPNEKKD